MQWPSAVARLTQSEIIIVLGDTNVLICIIERTPVVVILSVSQTNIISPYKSYLSITQKLSPNNLFLVAIYNSLLLIL